MIAAAGEPSSVMPRRRRLPPDPKPVIHPDLAPILARRDGIEAEIDRLQDERAGVNAEVQAAVAAHYNTVNVPIAHVAPVNADDLEVMPIWVCEKGSPTGHCVYDDVNDPAHDSCLFCGEPRERK